MKPAAFFDLEKTLTPFAVEQTASFHFYRQKQIPLSTVLRAAWVYLAYNLGLLKNFETMKAFGARSFSGRSHSSDIAAADLYFSEFLQHHIYPQARKFLEEFQNEGGRVYLISSTYDFFVAPYAKHLKADGYYGVQLETVDDICTGNLIGRIPHQENKAKIVEEIAKRDQIDLARSYAFGDSINDAAMLAKVGHPRAVNPGRKLKKLASARDWTILTWHQGS